MVQERLTQAHYLPNVCPPSDDVAPPVLNERVMAIGLTSKELSTVQLSILARWTVRPRWMGIPGVANVSIWGLAWPGGWRLAT